METEKLGLSSNEARKLLKKFGRNEISRRKKVSAWKILLAQFSSPLILILIFSAILLGFVSYFSSEKNLLDIGLIVAVVLISGISGFFQDYKAEKSIEAIQKMAMPKARVIRDGIETLIPSSEIVKGDVILLDEGSIVPADARIISSSKMKVDESILTGESHAVKKRKGDLVYMNTSVVVGRALAIVEKTGMGTAIGKIAGKLESMEEEKSVFYQEMQDLSKKLSFMVIIAAIIITVAGFFKYGLFNSILSGVALAVAAVPEGLPAVLILSLAAGSKVMAEKKALIRRLGVVESMGSVNVICTDKTGTLTKNEMQVVTIFSEGISFRAEEVNPEKNIELIKNFTLNNNVRETFDGKERLVGDETEVALYKFSKKKGFGKEVLEKSSKRIAEIPFDPRRAMMSVVIREGTLKKVYTKGAPEAVVRRCDRILIGGKVRKIRKKDIERILEANNEFASKALRVLGFAFKEVRGKIRESEAEKNLIWLGMAGMIDPPRPEVKKAVGECKSAGIRVIVLTGDNPLTARAISERIGLKSSGFVIGEELNHMSDNEISRKLSEGVNIFARLNPDHKLRIMSILKEKGNIIAMTGDGVNDALALKKADVGIAMGIRGTEVAKQASDLVLLDDNFATIVSAIREGRRIFDNIRKFVNYLLTSNLAEVLIIFFATIFLALKEPILLPVQLLWINLLTDGLPAIALGLDPARRDIMKEKPRKKSEHVIDKRLSAIIAAIGVKKTIILILTFLVTLHFYNDAVARTTVFTGIILYEFVRIGVIRSSENLGWFSNKLLLSALLISIVFQAIVVYTPLRTLFRAVPLGTGPLAILGVGVITGYASAIFITRTINTWFSGSKEITDEKNKE
ncbi:cation-translocating P-type ATPase [Candidatus Pacearchaeota archaeon]|nr:MAG: cation-translocating P-type ATPase [Candidatus Pacearchaeota archaeon]